MERLTAIIIGQRWYVRVNTCFTKTSVFRDSDRSRENHRRIKFSSNVSHLKIPSRQMSVTSKSHRIKCPSRRNSIGTNVKIPSRKVAVTWNYHRVQLLTRQTTVASNIRRVITLTDCRVKCPLHQLIYRVKFAVRKTSIASSDCRVHHSCRVLWLSRLSRPSLRLVTPQKFANNARKCRHRTKTEIFPQFCCFRPQTGAICGVFSECSLLRPSKV